ncbi:MAG: hypothetical protein HUU30_07615 [Burkholderiaceae bacterium]|nr:hypothetical protein [Burkholderiaceae bacterium]
MHNLFGGLLDTAQELKRVTPYHAAHATTVVDRANIPGGDDRWYNNVFTGGATEPPKVDPKIFNARRRFTGYGTWIYDAREHPSFAGGNVYYRNARPSASEVSPVVLPTTDPQVKVVAEDDRVFLQADFPAECREAATQPVTTALLGRARIPNLPFENPDGSPLTIETDYFGKKRDATRPTAGPFENAAAGPQRLKVW